MQRSTRLPSASWTTLLLSIVLIACDGGLDASRTAERDADGPRIVSFSPAISRTLVDLGVDDQIVGRTPYCRSLDPGIPIVGDLHDINYEMLIGLQPTQVLVQPSAAGLDSELQRLAELHGWAIEQWRLDTLDDIEQLVRDLPRVLYAEKSPELEATAESSARLLNEMALALSPGGEPIWRGRVLLVYSEEPVGAFGTGTYLHEVLSALGQTNAVASPGWPQLSLEDVIRMDPEAIVIVRDAPNASAAADGPLSDLPVVAVGDNRVRVFRHPDAMLPSSGVTDVAVRMRELFALMAEDSP